MVSDVVRYLQENCEKQDLNTIVEFLFDEGILNEKACKKIQVKFHYKKLRRFYNAEVSIQMLSSSFFVSASTIENYIYRK